MNKTIFKRLVNGNLEIAWRLRIEERWMMTHPERVRAQSRIADVQYHKSVDDVEHFVVMWLLELIKLQTSGLGYKLRTQIAKALKTRATAIRNALNHYNKYEVVESSQLAEFDLLRDTDNQLLDKCWAIPRNCQVIRDNAIHFPVVISQLRTSNPTLAVEVQSCWDYLCSVDVFHLSCIAQIEALPGRRVAGMQLGHMDSALLQAQPKGHINEGNGDDDVHDDPDGEQQTLVEEFFDQLHDGPICADEV
ncbi:hypothetical protein F4604DRAFT_1883425 [Suillus subluteus]|nr:hypothetical protein F4604DRAFT_1883425 [Suillus subluteus]